MIERKSVGTRGVSREEMSRQLLAGWSVLCTRVRKVLTFVIQEWVMSNCTSQPDLLVQFDWFICYIVFIYNAPRWGCLLQCVVQNAYKLCELTHTSNRYRELSPRTVLTFNWNSFLSSGMIPWKRVCMERYNTCTLSVQHWIRRRLSCRQSFSQTGLVGEWSFLSSDIATKYYI